VPPYPCYCDGKLRPAGRHDLNPVTWWILKRHSVALLGPAAPTLDFATAWDALVAYMADNLDAYWLPFTRAPVRLAWLLTDAGVQWAVLGICRLWFAFREGDITSKLHAGEVMLRHAQEPQQLTLAEALAILRGDATRHYRLRLLRAREAAAFVGYAIRECRAFLS
jgi:hypothetical protein